MTERTMDWRADFRLHGMDIETDTNHSVEPHWILREKGLLDMLDSLETHYLALCNAGVDPFPGEELSYEAMIAKLGFADRPQPDGAWAWGRLMVAFVIAYARETIAIQGRIGKLRQAARPGY